MYLIVLQYNQFRELSYLLYKVDVMYCYSQRPIKVSFTAFKPTNQCLFPFFHCFHCTKSFFPVHPHASRGGCWVCISHCISLLRSISLPQLQSPSYITHCMKNVFWCWSLYTLWMELAACSFSREGRTSWRLWYELWWHRDEKKGKKMREKKHKTGDLTYHNVWERSHSISL